VRSADTSNIVSTMIGGTSSIWPTCSWWLAIDMAGLAIAFLSPSESRLCRRDFQLRPPTEGECRALAGGVLCALIAVVMDGKAYAASYRRPRVSKKSIVVCWYRASDGAVAPFVAHAMTTGNTLGPYSIAVFLTLGALLSCLIWNVYFMKHPLVGQPVKFSGFFSAPASAHALGLLGGFIWGTAWFSIWSPPASPA